MQRQLMNGERRIGVTVHWMTPRFDDGPILAQAAVDAADEDALPAVVMKLARQGKRMLAGVLDELQKESCVPGQPQPAEGAGYFPKLRREDRCVDWHWPTRRVCDLVRAMPERTPAFAPLERRRLLIHACHATGRRTGATPGCFLGSSDGTLVVATGDGAVRITRYEFAHTAPYALPETRCEATSGNRSV